MKTMCQSNKHMISEKSIVISGRNFNT